MQPVTGPSAVAADDLAATARRVLLAGGIPEAAAGPGGGLADTGFLAAPLHALGPARVTITWCEAGLPRPCQSRPGPGLARCKATLAAAGCRSEYVVAADGGYLAVLAPAGA
jgi:hypothetical protein